MEDLPRGDIHSFKMTGEQKLERITPEQAKDIRAQQYARIGEEKDLRKRIWLRKPSVDPVIGPKSSDLELQRSHRLA